MIMVRIDKSQAGLSLIELMVAVTLGLMITTTMGYILMGSRSTYQTQDASARVQDTGRFALNYIGRQIRAAGRTDITPLASDGRLTLPAGATAISGVKGAAAAGGAAAVNANGAVPINGGTRQTDTLTVQYEMTGESGTTEISDCNGGSAGIAKTNIPNTTPQMQYGTVTNVIGINVTGTRLDLRCTGNGGGGAQPFAEGVEDLQFRYALSTAPSVFIDATSIGANWNNVIAVQVCIMVQSPNNGALATIQTVRDCSGAEYTPNDTRLRRTFTSVFTMRNRINAVP